MNYLGIDPTTVEKTVEELNTLLSNYQIYYQNLRRYHWSITGESFFDLHPKFEELYNEAKLNIDDIAERILTLRSRPLSTLKEYLSNAKIKESKAKTSKDMVSNILEDHKVLIESLRRTIKAASKADDEGTIDMTGGFLSSVEKNSWMLAAWLN